jgi:dUTP pyrophosphatase
VTSAQQRVTVRVKRIDQSLDMPSYAYPGDAGLDLRAACDCTLAPHGRALVPTGIAVALPAGYAGFVLPRSGLAARVGLSIANAPGLIDSQYRGEVKVVAVNLDANDPIELRKGDRIAQLVVLAHPFVELVECDELDDTVRGVGGFGSSGR